FAMKWIDLCAAHLGDEGIRDPIRCYEYLGRFYVQEGNKRVSVLKSYEASTIPGYVIRLLPVYSQEPKVQQYYEFLQFYQLTRLYRVNFSQTGSFPKLQAAMGFEPGHVWTDEERRRFISRFTFFQQAFDRLGGADLVATSADAFLVWLKVYSFDQLGQMSMNELIESLESVWSDVKVLTHDAPISMAADMTDADIAAAEGAEEKGIFSRLFSSKPATAHHLKVAFIHQLTPSSSTWINAHEQGRKYMQDVLGDKVSVQTFYGVGTGEEAEAAMATAIENGAQVIFATTPPLIGACRRVAALHPEVKMLNCSVSMPYTGVRTYYSRIYEGKFLSGAIAGAMSKRDRVGYIASYPIFGVLAGINAFALGLQLTNPKARVELRWSCTPGAHMDDLKELGLDFISTLDIPTPDCVRGRWGACQVLPDGSTELLASPYWDWGRFYVKLVHSIMHGSWDALNSNRTDERAVNYWWGMASGVIGVRMNPSLPEGVQNLVQILQKGICDGSITPFHRRIVSQDGTVRNDGGKYFSLDEILHMDWLLDTIDGSIPAFDELLPQARDMVRLQGVYRDSIPPEKEGVLL
ncbi:MAG: BMP family ABC transporter substrate-binding protein, partial [Oscillibacter sp.]|nr:BMP family ABC transporter substrate-binding protein [Oscillibacter sp.]